MSIAAFLLVLALVWIVPMAIAIQVSASIFDHTDEAARPHDSWFRKFWCLKCRGGKR